MIKASSFLLTLLVSGISAASDEQQDNAYRSNMMSIAAPQVLPGATAPKAIPEKNEKINKPTRSPDVRELPKRSEAKKQRSQELPLPIGGDGNR